MRESVKRTGPHSPVDRVFHRTTLARSNTAPRVPPTGEPSGLRHKAGRILFGGALSKPITYGRLLLPPEKRGAEGSIAIFGRFSAGMSSQKYGVSLMAGYPPAAKGLVQKLRLPRCLGSTSSGPKREGRPAGRWLPNGSCHVAGAARQGAYAGVLAGPRSFFRS
jgi:hypothetical protein